MTRAKKLPAYGTGLSERADCRFCNASRLVQALGAWQPCDGGGPYRQVRCAFCKTEFSQFKERGCNHVPGTVDCLVWKRDQST